MYSKKIYTTLVDILNKQNLNIQTNDYDGTISLSHQKAKTVTILPTYVTVHFIVYKEAYHIIVKLDDFKVTNTNATLEFLTRANIGLLKDKLVLNFDDLSVSDIIYIKCKDQIVDQLELLVELIRILGFFGYLQRDLFNANIGTRTPEQVVRSFFAELENLEN